MKLTSHWPWRPTVTRPLLPLALALCRLSTLGCTEPPGRVSTVKVMGRFREACFGHLQAFSKTTLVMPHLTEGEVRRERSCDFTRELFAIETVRALCVESGWDLPLVFCQPIWCLDFPACGLWLPHEVRRDHFLITPSDAGWVLFIPALLGT